MEEKCRVCMGTSGPFTNIFDETFDWNTCIAELIAECTGYVVKRGDYLPEIICPPCLEDAVGAYNLKKTCEWSHRRIFSVFEEDMEDSFCDNLEDEDSEISSTREEQPILETQNLETDAIMYKDDLDLDLLLDVLDEDLLFSLKRNDKLHRCSHCSRTFRHKKRLETHALVHTVEHQRYICPFCTMDFSQRQHLQRHIRTHTEERPYKCSYCSKTFAQSGTLSVHVRTHTGERPHQCSYCSKSFIKKCELIAHIRIHTGERPFKCNQCSKAFTRQQTLQYHIRSHLFEING